MSFRYVNDLWDEESATLSPLDFLVRRANWLGSDPRVTHSGGGSVSAKVVEKDPITGQPVEVLWVTGAGTDLRTATAADFISFRLSRLVELHSHYTARRDKGIRSPAEEDTLTLLPDCVFRAGDRAPSAETALHTFLPGLYGEHLHSNAILALAACRKGAELTAKVFGREVAWLAWTPPGFELGLAVQELARKQPEIKGVLLARHGLVCWDDDPKASYSRALDYIEKASEFIEQQYTARGGHTRAFGGQRYQSIEFHKRNWTMAQFLPWLRGQLSRRQRQIATLQNDDATMRFVNSRNAQDFVDLGFACPDHFQCLGIRPVFVNWNPQGEDVAELKLKLAVALEQFHKDYAEYYREGKELRTPPKHDVTPAVILIPGLGIVAWGRNKDESRLAAELCAGAIEAMRGAEAMDEYAPLPREEAFYLEYSAREEARRQALPPEKELARQVVVVIGGGTGIGRQAAVRLAQEGAHVVCADLATDAAVAAAKEINDQHPAGLGQGGSGISACAQIVGIGCDITRRASIRAMLDQTALAFGGFDSIIITAGISLQPDATGRIPDDKWASAFAVHVMGGYLVGDEAAKSWKEQGLPGNLVLTTSANAVAAREGNLPGDTSQAAANHLVRELAVTLSPLVRVNGVAPATVVAGSASFPRERIMKLLGDYKIAFAEGESNEALAAKLAQHHAEHSLTRLPVTLSDAAEACFLLVSPRLSKTTGHIIAVDGGLPEAFLR